MLEDGKLGGGNREGDVEAGGGAVFRGDKVEGVCGGGSLPGSGGVGIEASADMV
jgi:hypothetical protein